MGTRSDGIHGAKIHGRGANHCLAESCIFTPDCSIKQTGKVSSKGSVKKLCIYCGGTISQYNAENLPYLCNSCLGIWKTTPREISLAGVWGQNKTRDNLFLVVVNFYNIAGIYYPKYRRYPVLLGFIAGRTKKNGEIRFFSPRQALKTLSLLNDEH